MELERVDSGEETSENHGNDAQLALPDYEHFQLLNQRFLRVKRHM